MTAPEPEPVTLIKFGGSLLTDKRQPRTVRMDVLQRLARELEQALRIRPCKIVLGHGSGSFGHVAAKAADLGAGLTSPSQRVGVGRTQFEVRALSQHVLLALLEAGLAPYVLAPSSFLVTSDRADGRAFTEPVTQALAAGLIPVVGGDVVLDRRHGVAIVSTEQVLTRLVTPLTRAGHPIVRALWLGETDGLYDPAGQTVPTLDRERWATLEGSIGAAAGTDVTGGMRLRITTCLALADRGITSKVLNGTRAGALAAALAGERDPNATTIPAR